LTHCHVIVIGAGIGGLTAALSLQRYGFKVSVYEQASELREFGAGILVTPNAMHALEFLGVGEVIAATSNVSNEQLMRHFQSGKIIHRRPDGHYYMSKYGAGHFQVHRADLHNALKAAVLANDSDCVHLAHTFNRLLQSERGVTAYFVNGMVVEGDALIGCDGSRSAVREAVYGSAPVSYSGQVAFRALIPCENDLPHLGAQGACMYIGPNRMFLHYPLRKNRLMNVVAISRQPRWEQEGWTISAKVSELLELYQDFHPLVLGMIGTIHPETLFKWGLRDRSLWSNGREDAFPRSVMQHILRLLFSARARSWPSKTGWCSDDALQRPPLPKTHCCVTSRRASSVPMPCKSIRENAQTRCKAPISRTLGQDEALMISACSNTIQPPCQSEKAEMKRPLILGLLPQRTRRFCSSASRI
jgi:salicylate hydroxylase